VKRVSLITNGSCLGNPGPGGWACLLRFGAAQKELFGYDPQTTNNRAELMAAIQGLLALKEPCQVEVTTDAEYLRQGITLWKRRQWWHKHHPARNADLWIELDELVAIHQTTWNWTRGHAIHDDNNRCDWLAQNAARMEISSWSDRRPQGQLLRELGTGYILPKPQAGLFEDPDASDEGDYPDT
jgi:ribonuclease HI